MSVNFFVDTNIFIYTFDQLNRTKQSRALELVAYAFESGNGMISYQVVQEFLNVATQKFKVPLKIEDSLTYMHKVLNPLCRVFPDLALYENCLNIQGETHYSFYDSLILASAIRGGCEILYSEDLQDGQRIQSVQIINPFSGNQEN